MHNTANHAIKIFLRQQYLSILSLARMIAREME